MGMLTPRPFEDHLTSLTDPRCPNAPNRCRLLSDILAIAVCAVSLRSRQLGRYRGVWNGPNRLARSRARIASKRSDELKVTRQLIIE